MKIAQSGSVMRMAIIGSILIAIILVLGTFWTGHNASRDTEQAVHAVSLLYLGELSERREQVVASTLQGYVSNLDVAIGLLDKNDLTSVESLQAYQARMKQLYRVEKFAFVNSKGIIYTSRGTRTDIDQYPFTYLSLSSSEIHIKNLEGKGNKKLIIAAPVDRLPFMGDHLVVCFMEIDMATLLQTISLTSNNNTTFCNLYTSAGDSLTDSVLGGLANETNLLKALENASFQSKGALERMRENFLKKRPGVVSFTYNNIRETMNYVPIHGTDLMLTYLVRESVITAQISSIYEGMITRNLLQSIATILVLAALFGVMISQIRKAAKVALEKEVSETANRVRQKELEEQLALQEQLLAQEKERLQKDSMITALSVDYRGVFFVNLNENTAQCYRKDASVGDLVGEGDSILFRETFLDYAHRFVTDEYRDAFVAFLDAEKIRAGLAERPILSFRYLVMRDGHERYEMLRIVKAGTEGAQDETIKTIGLGITDIDAEMRDEMQKSQALSDALKTAEEANKAKTIFLSNMSHEIRTPMNAIIGLDNLALNEAGISDKTRDYLEKIGSSAQHLLSLINDILDMSRIESGRMVLRNEEFAFSKLIENINTIVNGQCQDKGLNYTCRINGEVDDYYIGDNVKLRQVLINILGNAVKFTPSGGNIDFLVEKTANYEGKSTLRFTIKDTGVGMNKEFLPKLFETFSQEDSNASNKYGSSGLGMAITKNIIEMMNGEIAVESEKGVGSTFTVTVTLLDAEERKGGEADDIQLNPAEMSVLVVDDDPVACDHAKLVLEKVGISSEIALSGQKAIDMVKLRQARCDPYNLIIIDWQMPEMDGVEATRIIRSLIGSNTAIIILTAYNWDDVHDEAVAAGVDSFIAKPLFPGSVIDEVKNAMRKKIEKGNTKKKADLRGLRVLLAEDMLINAEIMMEVLEMREMKPEHAENGKIAVEMFASHPVGYYDVILMDMRMPEMNGIEATTAIRAMDREDAKSILIIALTANAFDEDVQRSLQAGLNAHLSKPVNPDVLFETLESML
ncbi:MAG: response regulator [Desulfovibrionaceae bacterium]|nr:response regulator [Desulfovibrionaceae bacterium]